jgi:hypothetical protein
MKGKRMNYDVIGDIHGEADKLEALLARLGYTDSSAGWKPPQGHIAIFVGDLIDRGPKQVETVQTVRRMVDAGHAHCVLGNHEYNAIAYTMRTPANPREFLRPHTNKNQKQHAAFLAQVGEGSALHREFVGWFQALPPSLDLDSIRVSHAWWNDDYIATVNSRLAGKAMDEAFIQEAYTKHTPLWHAMEGITKGMEVPLPQGHSFHDHEGVERSDIRVRWWQEDPAHYREYAMVTEKQRHRLPAIPVLAEHTCEPVSGSPIFVGHYWLEGRQQLDSNHVACVDYSAAGDGPLVCYRWQGETALTARHFVTSHDRAQ